MRKLSFESTETTFVVPQRANEDDPGRFQKNYHSGRPKRRENIRTETPASSEDPRGTVKCPLSSLLERKGWELGIVVASVWGVVLRTLIRSTARALSNKTDLAPQRLKKI